MHLVSKLDALSTFCRIAVITGIIAWSLLLLKGK